MYRLDNLVVLYYRRDVKMSQTAARRAHAEKMKTDMMKVMGITDPAEFQQIAR